MKKLLKIFLCVCLVFVTITFTGCKNDEQTSTKSIKILGLGDSISAGYAPQDTDLHEFYQKYINKEVKINEKCFTKLISNYYSANQFTSTATSYANSGDDTSDLVEKLNNKKNYPDLLLDIKNADVITVSIGANNILKYVLTNLNGYLSGNIELVEIETMFQQGLEQFKDNYTNTIIPILTRDDAKVFVMTVYDPYQFFDLNDFKANDFVKLYISSITDRFNSLKDLAIEYIGKINSFIKSQIYQNVFVVDVEAKFKSMTKDEFNQNIFADSSQIEINSQEDLDNLAFNKYADIHPTIDGQEYIANLFIEKINQVLSQAK